MKKILLATIILFSSIIGFSSCSDDDEAPFLGAYVEVTVKDILGNAYKEGTVYMFKDVDPDANTDRGSASKSEKTNTDGIAQFKLDLTELNITESKTNLYFAVYYSNDDGDFVVKAGDGADRKKK